MPSTYTLISSNILSSSAASVTFSAIPSTYTDLVLRTSTRTDLSGGTDVNLYITFNGSSASTYSDTRLQGTGSAANSNAAANQTYLNVAAMSIGTAYTASTFSNTETYIPSYTASQNKPMSDFSVTENNATAARMYASANLWRNTAAITSITLVPAVGNLISGSSFYLYGIKNS
jgi:hypothetical protein